MVLNEQDIMNAICLNTALRKQIRPEAVDVQLMYDDDLGYSAEVTAMGRSQFIIEATILEAIEQYLYKEHGLQVFRSQISLDIEDEMIARVAV